MSAMCHSPFPEGKTEVKNMRTIKFDKNNRSGNLLHIEAEGCIINVRVGLVDMIGQKVTSVEIVPDKPEGWEMGGASSVSNRIVQRSKEHGRAT